MTELPTAKFGSWVNLLYRAGTTRATRAADLLPRYYSLTAPPANVLSDVEDLVDIMHTHPYWSAARDRCQLDQEVVQIAEMDILHLARVPGSG